MTPMWREVYRWNSEEDIRHYQCLYCYEEWDSVTSPKDWTFCPYCRIYWAGREWTKKNPRYKPGFDPIWGTTPLCNQWRLEFYGIELDNWYNFYRTENQKKEEKWFSPMGTWDEYFAQQHPIEGFGNGISGYMKVQLLASKKEYYKDYPKRIVVQRLSRDGSRVEKAWPLGQGKRGG